MSSGKFTSTEKFMLYIVFGALSIFCYCYIFFIGYNGLDWCDFITQRAVCEATLKGLDIYTLRGESELIYTGFHAVPWGCLIGNIFYPGFLSLEAGKIYFLAINIVALAIVSYILYRKIKDISGELGLLTLFMSVLSVDFLFAIYMGNAGFMVCALLILAWTIRDDHPYIAGILIGLAMTKPQTAAIICILLLVMGYIKPLIVGAVIDVAAWFVVSVMTKTGMFELLTEFLFMSSGMSDTTWQAGVFTFVFNDGLFSVTFSMIFGIIFVLLLYKFTPISGGGGGAYLKVYPAMLASNFWSYGNITEGYMSLLPAVICLWIMMNQRTVFKRFLWFSFSLWCLYEPVFRSVFRIILQRVYITLAHDLVLSWLIGRNIYQVGLVIIGIAICLELRCMYYRKAEL